MRKETSWISKSAQHNRTGYYEDCNDFSNLPQEKIQAVCAFSFYKDKFVLVKNGPHWEPVAGHVEKGELPEDALIREIQEESNMKVLKYFPIGYLYIREVDIYQAQYLCLVEPYGPFVSDPDGGVTENILIDFSDIPKYLDKGDTSNLTLGRCWSVFKKIDKNK